MSNTSPEPADLYLFETYDDRDRLYHQFELTRTVFNESFDRALNYAGIDTTTQSRFRVLDIGCGEGLWAGEIVRRYPDASIVGIDRDATAITTATQVYGAYGDLHFYVNDARDPLPEVFDDGVAGTGFDIIVIWVVLMHIRETTAALHTTRKALRPGGVVLLRDPATDWLDFPHESVMALAALTTQAGRLAGSFDIGSRHTVILEAAGFSICESLRQRYVMGGSIPSNQRDFVHLVQTFAALRGAVVGRLALMDAATFDTHLARIRTETTTAMEGFATMVLTIGRKPT